MCGLSSGKQEAESMIQGVLRFTQHARQRT